MRLFANKQPFSICEKREYDRIRRQERLHEALPGDKPSSAVTAEKNRHTERILAEPEKFRPLMKNHQINENVCGLLYICPSLFESRLARRNTRGNFIKRTFSGQIFFEKKLEGRYSSPLFKTPLRKNSILQALAVKRSFTVRGDVLRSEAKPSGAKEPEYRILFTAYRVQYFIAREL